MLNCTLRGELIPSAAACFTNTQRLSSGSVGTEWKRFRDRDLLPRQRRAAGRAQRRRLAAVPLPRAEGGSGSSGCGTPESTSPFLVLLREEKIFRGPDESWGAFVICVSLNW